jgi:TrwC relaxase
MTHESGLNLAPRRDGSWGAIVSRELYKGQKQAGATYRQALASEIERQGIRLERQKDTFRVAAIPRPVERAFSKRRQAIEEAAKATATSTPKGMELATLRTRRPKWDAKLSELTTHWQAEAKALGIDLGRSRDRMHATTSGRSHAEVPGGRGPTHPPVVHPSPPTVLAADRLNQHQSVSQLGSRLGQVLRTLDQPAGMSDVRIKLRYREHERD